VRERQEKQGSAGEHDQGGHARVARSAQAKRTCEIDAVEKLICRGNPEQRRAECNDLGSARVGSIHE
jgi:hypothetical protein